MKKARKTDWKTVDMPQNTASFSLDITLTEEEYCILQNGFIPREMEDKWFLYFENGNLFAHRSWTGFCIYKISFSKEGNVLGVTVNRNLEQYQETNLEKDKIQATILINMLTKRPGNGELIKQYIKSLKKD